MSNPAQSALGDPSTFAAPRSGSVLLARLRRALVFPVKFFLGVLFCQSLVGSILIIGWTYRLAQRSVLKYWWSRSAGSRGQGARDFKEFVSGSTVTQPHRHWPNWFAQQNFLEAIRRQPGISLASYALSVLKALVHSLCLNLWIGLSAAFNTCLLTLPACLFWWFGWYDGWNNSFNKGYEQAAVGPLISVFGIFWFIAAMFYVPLAQARQAVAGEWRSFYDFRLVWNIARLRWLSCVGLAMLYVVFAIPLTVMKTGPMFGFQSHPELSAVTDMQLLKYLNDYFFRCALIVLPAYVALRLVAARIYASGILSLVQMGKIPSSRLAQNERDILERLDLLTVQSQPERHYLVRFLAWTGTRVGRTVGRVALALIWFGFVAQIYIGEFLNNHGARGWLNQPLVQLPWFHYLPARMKNPFEEAFAGLVIAVLALLIRRGYRAFQARKREVMEGEGTSKI